MDRQQLAEITLHLVHLVLALLVSSNLEVLASLHNTDSGQISPFKGKPYKKCNGAAALEEGTQDNGWASVQPSGFKLPDS